MQPNARTLQPVSEDNVTGYVGAASRILINFLAGHGGNASLEDIGDKWGSRQAR
jgi:hypothetical protein